MDNIKRGDKVILSRQQTGSIWLTRTPEELEALKKRDAENGKFTDDSGEPILYGPYSGWTSLMSEDECPSIEVTVTSFRPKWLSFQRRPKGLTAGWCESLNREVLFIRK